MSKIKAVVFDIDGTLLDTSEYIYQAFEHVTQKHNFPKPNREAIASQIGKKLEECYAFLAPDSNFELMHASHNDFQTLNLALIRAFDNVTDILQSIKRDGIKIGLWTGRVHNVVESLEFGGLDLALFDCIVDASVTPKGKPDPSGLLATLDLLGAKPDTAIMIGDAGLDIEAGKAAGVMATVGITHGFGTIEEIKKANPDYIIESIDYLLNIVRKLSK